MHEYMGQALVPAPWHPWESAHFHLHALARREVVHPTPVWVWRGCRVQFQVFLPILWMRDPVFPRYIV